MHIKIEVVDGGKWARRFEGDAVFSQLFVTISGSLCNNYKLINLHSSFRMKRLLIVIQ